MFKGIDHAVSTNLPSVGGLPHRCVIHTMRVDLTDPDIRLFSTPRIKNNYVNQSREVAGYTVSDFLRTNRLQVAINANTFEPGEYYLPAGTAMYILGLAISQGEIVSQAEQSVSSSILFDSSNRGLIIPTNWPATNVTGIFTAVSGLYPVLVGGTNVGYNYPTAGDVHGVNPRTAFGLSKDRRYLYLMTIDGRQPGYSEGAFDYETGEWLRLAGAYDGINLDGGGSTTLSIEDTTGKPVRLNKPSAVADSGRERTVGSHFGVFAKPLPGFINNVQSSPDDTTALITWTTLQPSTSQVQYGSNVNFGSASPIDPTVLTNHSVTLTGLTPNSVYYYRVLSKVGAQQYASSNFFFVTTNYVTTNHVFDITQSWKFSVEGFASSAWTAPGLDDSTWSGPGSGLLWVDVRPTGPNPAVEPKNTQMPANPANSGYPYRTYYFRTHFTLASPGTGSSLAISAFVDDGAVFYLNGSEIYRLRMNANPDSQTLALTYPCNGDAICTDDFLIPPESIPSLVAGDNVLAVEVHNYNALSADITFGMSLDQIIPVVRTAKLAVRQSGGGVTLTWDGSAFALQSAPESVGPWTDITGTVTSPFTTPATESARYFRLRGR